MQYRPLDTISNRGLRCGTMVNPALVGEPEEMRAGPTSPSPDPSFVTLVPIPNSKKHREKKKSHRRREPTAVVQEGVPPTNARTHRAGRAHHGFITTVEVKNTTGTAETRPAVAHSIGARLRTSASRLYPHVAVNVFVSRHGSSRKGKREKQKEKRNPS